MEMNMDRMNNQVAVFIDYENIEISYRSKSGDDFEVDWQSVFRAAVDFGRVVVRRAYADWGIFGSSQRELLAMGVDLVHVPSKRGKNAADIKIVIDALEMVLGESKNISHVVLVSGDGDFTELVHRLRAYGKVVIGLGVSGASAEYLIHACDQFIFYDMLTGRPAGKDSGENRSTDAPGIAFEMSEARLLLRKAVEPIDEGTWVTAGAIKNAMLGLSPAFNERNYNYSSFKDFIAAQSDMVRIRTAQPGGHLEVQKISLPASDAASKAPEALLDRYLNILGAEKIRMTPTEHRPAIILKYYESIKGSQERTLNQVKEALQAYFEEKSPTVKPQYVHETAHQLFRTYCFEFDQDDSKYSEDVRLWDRAVTLFADIKNANFMLDKCDRGLLQKILANLDEGEELHVNTAARLLYGTVKGQKMLQHVTDLINETRRASAKRRS